MADDVEKRLNLLFDALNCESLSQNVTDALIDIAQGKFLWLRYRSNHDPDISFLLQRCKLMTGKPPPGYTWNCSRRDPKRTTLVFGCPV